MRLIIVTLLALAACSPKQDDRVFAPEDSEFEVSFPTKPTLSEITGQGGLFSVPTTLKVATRKTKYMLLRADAAVVEGDALKAFTNDFLTSYGLSYGENQGFENVETRLEEKSFARCLIVRGHKKVEDQPTMFLTRMCLGKRTVFTQYIASSPSIFPPPGTQEFLESLRPR